MEAEQYILPMACPLPRYTAHFPSNSAEAPVLSSGDLTRETFNQAVTP